MEDLREDIGILLKTQREKLGQSLQDAALQTRIRQAYLENLENNQFSDLPGKAYVTGFLKVYARYLGLDSKALLKTLEETLSEEQPRALKQNEVFTQQRPVSLGKPAAKGEGWRVFLLGFVAVLLLGGAIYFIASLLQADDPDAAAPERLAAEQVHEQVQIGTAEKAENHQPDAAVAVPEVEAAPVAQEAKPFESAQLPSILPEGSSLRMLAIAESSLTIQHDERKTHVYSLHDGLDLTWKIKTEAKVELAEPGVARFWLDGQELSLGESLLFKLKSAPGE